MLFFDVVLIIIFLNVQCCKHKFAYIGYGGTGIFRCSTQWPIQLVSLLRQYLGWIPSDIDTQKKVYWCILLLDTLQGTVNLLVLCVIAVSVVCYFGGQM